MLLDEKVRQHKELSLKIAELEKEKKALSAEILEQMPKELNILIVSGYQVKRNSRILIKTSVEEAREFEAVIIEEVVDKDKLKKLHAMGHPIPKLSQYEYITIIAPKS